jgi:DHA1 family multidrug resistance protein-like MFS transporter
MSVHDAIRDAPFGQLMRLLSTNRVFQYPEEKSDFKLPDAWLESMNSSADVQSSASSTSTTPDKPQPLNTGANGEHLDVGAVVATDIEGAVLEKAVTQPIQPKRTEDGIILVDWYVTDDPANPHNWSNLRRSLLGSLIFFHTLVVYMTSSLYTSSTEDIMQKFGVSKLKAILGLSIYVLGYGVGPVLFSPLSEIARIGRSPVYIITMVLFVIISIPTALVDNFPGLIILRFLQAFFGSPCLASGGATMSDIYSMLYLPFAMIAWVAAAFCGRKSSAFWFLLVVSLTFCSCDWTHHQRFCCPC